MKKTIIALILLIAVGIAAFLLGREGVNAPNPNSEESNEAEIKGEVSSLDFNGVALDGPYIINITDEGGASSSIAVPSMGINLCVAKDNIVDFSLLKVGSKVEAKGIKNEDGQLIPCESQSHYLRIID